MQFLEKTNINLTKRFLITLSIVVTSSFILLFFYNEVSAEIITDISQATGTSVGTNWGQTFIPHFDNITKITPYIYIGSSTPGVWFVLCKGDASQYTAADIYTGTNPRTDVHCKSGDYQLVKQYYPNGLIDNNGFGVDRKWYDIEPLEDYWQVEIGAKYYYLLCELNPVGGGWTMNVYYNLSATDYYLDGSLVSFGVTHPNWDNKFKTYSDTTYYPPDKPPLDVEVITPDYTLFDWRSDINTVNYQMCFINKDVCNLYFSFNEKTIGKKVYLVPDIQYKQWPYYALSSTTVTYHPTFQNYVTTPTKTTATTTNYCLYLVDTTYGDILRCRTKIEWLGTSTFEMEFFKQNKIENACNTVASSTGGFDDLRYGVECGIRKISFWAFSSSPEAVQYFTNSGEKIKMVFPFNTYFNLVNAAQKAIGSTTMSKNYTIGLPMINQQGNYYILPVLSSSSMPNLIGQTNNNLFRNTLGWLMWLAVAILIYITFKKI